MRRSLLLFILAVGATVLFMVFRLRLDQPKFVREEQVVGSSIPTSLSAAQITQGTDSIPSKDQQASVPNENEDNQTLGAKEKDTNNHTEPLDDSEKDADTKADAILKKYGGERRFSFREGSKMYLIDLKRRDSLRLNEHDGQFEAVYEQFKTTDIKSLYYFSGSSIDSVATSSTSISAPICKVTFNRNSENFSAAQIDDFSVSEVSETNQPEGTRGVLIKISQTEQDPSWIQSIECFVKTRTPDDQSFRKIKVSHLFAALGVKGSLYAPRFNRTTGN